MTAPTVSAHPPIRNGTSPGLQFGTATAAAAANPPTVSAHPRILHGLTTDGHHPPAPAASTTPTVTNAHPRIFGAANAFPSGGSSGITNVNAPVMTMTMSFPVPVVTPFALVGGTSVTIKGSRGTSVVRSSERAESVSIPSERAETVQLHGPGVGSQVIVSGDDVTVKPQVMSMTMSFPTPTIATDVTVLAPVMTMTMQMLSPSVTGGSGSTIDIDTTDNIQAVIDANTSGKVYRLLAGTHRLVNGGSSGTTGIRLKAGDTIFGEKDSNGNHLTFLYGSRALSSWTSNGSYWRHDGIVENSFDSASTHKLSWATSGGPESIYYNGAHLLRVATQSEVLSKTPYTDPYYGFTWAGSVYIDETNNQAWISKDLTSTPNSETFEYAYVNKAFGGGADNITIKDIRIEYFANREQNDVISVRGSANATITGNYVANSWGSGITTGNGSTITDNVVTQMGQLGMHTIGSNSTVEYNEVSYNNLQGHWDRWEGGGMKTVFGNNQVIRGNHFHHNLGRSIWPDLENKNTTIEYNYVHDGADAGIVDEINIGDPPGSNLGSTIRYNVVMRCGYALPQWGWGAQIMLQNSRLCTIYDNYVETGGGGKDGIILVQQGHRQEVNPPYPTEGNEIYDNTIVFTVIGAGETGFAVDANPVPGTSYNVFDNSVNDYHDNDWFGPSGFTSGIHWKTRPPTQTSPGADDFNYATWVSHGRAVGDTTTNGVPSRSVTVTGTATQSIDESDIVAGGKVLTLTWDDRTDFWNTRIGSDPTVTQDFIDNAFSGDQSEFAEVTALMTIANFNRVSATTLTITLPATSTYNISSLETVTITIPGSACVRSEDLSSAGSFTIATA